MVVGVGAGSEMLVIEQMRGYHNMRLGLGKQ